MDVDIDGGGDYLDITSALAGESDDQCVLRVHAAAEAMDYYQDSLTIDGRRIAAPGKALRTAPSPAAFDRP